MTTPQRYNRIAFVASPGAEAQQALVQLVQAYGNHDPDDADVVVALGGRHLAVRDGRLRVTNDPERHSCRPSVDVLFRSAAMHAGKNAIGSSRCSR